MYVEEVDASAADHAPLCAFDEMKSSLYRGSSGWRFLAFGPTYPSFRKGLAQIRSEMTISEHVEMPLVLLIHITH